MSKEMEDNLPEDRIKSLADNMASEKLVSAIFNQSSLGVVELSIEGRIRRVNRKFTELIGYAPEELLGKSFGEITYPEDEQLSKEYITKLMTDTIDSFVLDQRCLHKDGNPVWTHLYSAVVRDGSGIIEYAIIFITDVTNLKDAEKELQIKNEEIYSQNEELRAQNEELIKVQNQQLEIIHKLETAEKQLTESRQRYQLLSEVTFEGILIHKAGKLVDANQSILKMTGYQKKDLEDLNLIDFVVKEDRSKIAENIGKDHASPYRVRAIKKNGEEFQIELEARDIFYQGEKLRIVSVRDITEKVKIEEALALSKNKFRFYINNAPSGFFAIDREGNYREVNQAFCKITGYSKAELMKMKIPDILHPSSITKGLDHYQQLEKKEYAISEIKFTRKDGTERIWQETGKKLSDGTYIAFTIDITDKIEYQNKLAAREKLLNFAVEQSPIPLIIAQAPDLKITHYNQAVIDLLTDKSKELKEVKLGEHRKYWPTFYPDGTPYKVADLPLTKAVKQGIVTHNQEIIVRHPDKDRWISANAAPLRNEKGEIIAGIVIFPEITIQKEIEQKIKEQENLLNEVGEIAKVGGWEFDIETGNATWTKGTYDIVEIPYSEHIPGLEEHVDYYLAEYREMINEKMNDLIDKGTPLLFEAELVTEQGNFKWCKALGRREMKNGKCVRVFGTFQDITEQKELGKAIKQKQAQMQSIMDNASDFILLSDNHGKPLFFNESYKRVMEKAIGLSVKPGDPPHTHLEDANQRAFWENLHKRVLSGETFKVEYSLSFKDGSKHYLDISYTPVIEDGKIQGFSEISRDVTDRKLHELELHASKEKYRILAETHQSIILTHDLEGVITYINPYGAEYLGKTESDIIGKSIDQFLPEHEQNNRAEKLWKTFMQDDFTQQVTEIDYINSDQEKRYLEITGSPILEADKPVAVLIVARDISKRKTTEAELKVHREKLEKLVEERTSKLKKQTESLERMNRLFVGRELRMKELKDNMKKLQVILKENNIEIDLKQFELPSEDK